MSHAAHSGPLTPSALSPYLPSDLSGGRFGTFPSSETEQSEHSDLDVGPHGWSATRRRTSQQDLDDEGGNRRLCALLLVVVAGTLGAAAYLAPGLVNTVLQDRIRNRLIIDSPAAAGYAVWQDDSIPNSPQVFYRMYMLNVTNPDAVLQGAVPVLQEAGPYVYRRYITRLNATFNANASEVCYYPWTTYQLVSGDDTEVVTSLNLPFQALMGALGRDWDGLLADFYNNTSDRDVLFATRSVRDFFFGYVDPVLLDIHDWIPWAHLTDGRFPGILDNQTFAANATAQGLSCEHTGRFSMAQMRQLFMWKGMRSMECCGSDGPCGPDKSGPPAWGSPAANEIRGTPGTQYHVSVTEADTLTVWVDPIYRYAQIRAAGTQTYKGVELIRFEIPHTTLLNASEDKANAQWFSFGDSGLLNLTTCARHIPVFVSKPHFLDADPALLQAVSMTPPVRSEHDTFVAVEPTLGSVFHAAERLQVNIEIAPIHLQHRTFFPNLTAVVAPVAWFEEGGAATDDEASEVKDSVYLFRSLATGVRWGGAALGALMLVAALCKLRSPSAADKKKRWRRGSRYDRERFLRSHSRSDYEDYDSEWAPPGGRGQGSSVPVPRVASHDDASATRRRGGGGLHSALANAGSDSDLAPLSDTASGTLLSYAPPATVTHPSSGARQSGY